MIDPEVALRRLWEIARRAAAGEADAAATDFVVRMVRHPNEQVARLACRMILGGTRTAGGDDVAVN